MGGTSYCVQCHVFRRTDELFHGVESTFSGVPQRVTVSDRLYPGAPPTIPHRIFMRENCASCHSGPSARPEIVCRHTDRTNCRQCHVPVGETVATNLTVAASANAK
jgi:cytochrome c-type protein NapB